MLAVVHAVRGQAVAATTTSATATSWRQCVQGALHPPHLSRRHPALLPRGAAPTGAARPDYTLLSARLSAWTKQVAKHGPHACPGLVQPTLVFSPVGGFADRLKGAVTAFYAALLTHARFQVAWTAPAALADYFDVDPAWLWQGGDEAGNAAAQAPASFQPGAVQARIPGAAIVHAVDEAGYGPFFDGAHHDFVRALAPPASANCSSIIFVTNAAAWLAVVRHQDLRPAADALGLSGLTQRQLFVLALHTLLRRPADTVVHGIDEVLAPTLDVRRALAVSVAFGGGNGRTATESSGRRRPPLRRKGPSRLLLLQRAAFRSTRSTSIPALIGVQIRTGGVGEAWTDSRLRHPVDSARCFAARALQVCQHAYGGACTVYLATDAVAAAAVFEQHVNGSLAVVRAPGPILHTDRPLAADPASPPTPDPWRKTHVDWVALGMADVLLTSHGGFGWTAAWAGGVPYVQQLRLGGEAACEWVDFDGCAAVPA